MKNLTLLTLLLLLASCTRTVYIPTESTAVRTDTDSLTRLIRVLIENNSSKKEKETLYVLQNREVTLNENGDTIKDKTDTFVNHDRQLEEENRQLRIENDSLRRLQSRTDSVYIEKPYPVEVVREVAKPLSWWEKSLIWLGIASLAFIVFLAIRWYKKK